MHSTTQLDQLLNYTLFHIAVCIFLGIAIIATDTCKRLANSEILRFSLSCLFVAGFAAGVIASNIPESTSFNDFSKSQALLFWGSRFWTYGTWQTIQHVAFSAALIAPALQYVICGADAFKFSTRRPRDC